MLAERKSSPTALGRAASTPERHACEANLGGAGPRGDQRGAHRAGVTGREGAARGAAPERRVDRPGEGRGRTQRAGHDAGGGGHRRRGGAGDRDGALVLVRSGEALAWIGMRGRDGW